MSLIAPLRSRLPSHFRNLTASALLARRTIVSPVLQPPAPADAHHASSFEGVPNPGLRALIFGAPGSGKGTLSQKVLDVYKSVHLISVGDVLRKEIAAGSEIGRRAKNLVAKGDFVPDELMLDIALGALPPPSSPSSWILDGFPRTIAQGRMLDERLTREGRPLNMIVNLGVSDATILKRIADRWIHVPSGRVYNDSYNPPKVPGKDDETGEPLSKRPDDNPETFAHRLELYNEKTFPLLKYYGDSAPSIVHVLKGETSDAIWPDMDILLQKVLGEHDV